MPIDILIVDDEADIRAAISGILGDEGYETRVAHDSDTALAALAERRPSLMVLDVWLQGSRLDGIELLDEVKQRDPTLPVVVISGHGNIETAVAAIKRGAYDFIEKPFRAEQLLLVVQRATETERLKREYEALKERIGFETELTGSSPQINAVRATLKRVAATGSRVLITGAAGAGKEVAGRLLHQWSPRAGSPFVVVSAARMTPERVEEALVRGRGKRSPGALRPVRTGPWRHLFLDDVADMPMPTQAKILRVLTEQIFQRVGGSRWVRVDVRVISATSRDLIAEIAAGRFREDFYYRLNVVPVRLPSLSERREDVAELVQYFIARYAAERRVSAPRSPKTPLRRCRLMIGPGNVRQLRNVVERTLILAPGDGSGSIDISMLPSEVTAEPARLVPGQAAKSIMGTPLREAREAFEREYLRAQIRRFSGNISRTAAFIGMERSALHRKLKALGLSDDVGDEPGGDE
jgi:two-component system, NtrC family, nitrogen regulation response regulator NtrX